MRVFVTGGTGLIGSAVIAELRRGGHRVLALARSEASAANLEESGAEPFRGNLGDLDALRAGAAQADGVIHLAFSNDFSSPENLAAGVAEEAAAMAALGEALAGSDRPYVTVSGTPTTPGRLSTEADPLPLDGPVGGRSRSVNAVLDLKQRGRTVVLITHRMSVLVQHLPVIIVSPLPMRPPFITCAGAPPFARRKRKARCRQMNRAIAWRPEQALDGYFGCSSRWPARTRPKSFQRPQAAARAFRTRA